MSRIYSSSTVTVTDYASFAVWHAANVKGYIVPSKESVIQRSVNKFDPATDCFYRIMGQFAPVPGERQDIPWRDVAEDYDSMYGSFASYGTN